MSEASAVATAAARKRTIAAPITTPLSEECSEEEWSEGLACSVPTAAEELDVGQSTIWKLLRERRIKSVKVFNRRLDTGRELQRIVSEPPYKESPRRTTGRANLFEFQHGPGKGPKSKVLQQCLQ